MTPKSSDSAAIPSLRARDCSKNEKEALNYLFLLIPLLNILIPFFWKSFAVVWSADTIAFFLMYAWKVISKFLFSSICVSFLHWFCSLIYSLVGFKDQSDGARGRLFRAWWSQDFVGLPHDVFPRVSFSSEIWTRLSLISCKVELHSFR